MEDKAPADGDDRMEDKAPADGDDRMEDKAPADGMIGQEQTEQMIGHEIQMILQKGTG